MHSFSRNNFPVPFRRVEIIGGGPGGLYLARLLKLSQPDWRVIVHERQSPDDTFGFGVGFSRRTLDNLAAADLQVHAAIQAIAQPIERVEFHTRLDRGYSPARGAIGISRTALLRALLEHALKAGVEIEVGQRTHYTGLAEADVIVAADGVGSTTRQEFAGELEAEVLTGAGLYLWCGSEVPLKGTTFATAETEHGLFVTHAYPYSSHLSTFLVETDETTWRKAGLDRVASGLTPGESDETSLHYLEYAFKDLLDGHSLIGNRTNWLRFRTVKCGRWSHQNIVLLGDAAHTAHYSIGSGTKLAMEDAIALCQALVSSDDIPAAFKRYELERRPAVARLQTLAMRSQAWWESYKLRVGLPAARVFVSYFTRAGAVRLSQLATSDPATVRAAAASFGVENSKAEVDNQFVGGVLGQTFSQAGVSLPGRLIDRGWQEVPPAIVTWPGESAGLRCGGTGESGLPSYVEAWEPLQVKEAYRAYPDALVIGVIESGAVIAWSEAGNNLLEQCCLLMKAGCKGIRLTSDPALENRDRLLSRLDLAERVRREAGGMAVVEGSAEYIEDLVAGLLAGRTDLIALK